MSERLIIIDNTENTFDEKVLKNEGKVLVNFYADWFGPCQQLLPTLPDLLEREKNLTICKVNIENMQELAMTYNVRSIPTLILFDKGEVKDTKTWIPMKGNSALKWLVEFVNQ